MEEPRPSGNISIHVGSLPGFFEVCAGAESRCPHGPVTGAIDPKLGKCRPAAGQKEVSAQ